MECCFCGICFNPFLANMQEHAGNSDMCTGLEARILLAAALSFEIFVDRASVRHLKALDGGGC